MAKNRQRSSSCLSLLELLQELGTKTGSDLGVKSALNAAKAGEEEEEVEDDDDSGGQQPRWFGYKKALIPLGMIHDPVSEKYLDKESVHELPGKVPGLAKIGSDPHFVSAPWLKVVCKSLETLFWKCYIHASEPKVSSHVMYVADPQGAGLKGSEKCVLVNCPDEMELMFVGPISTDPASNGTSFKIAELGDVCFFMHPPQLPPQGDVVVPAWLAKPSAKREQITLEPQHSSVSVFILESGEVVARDPEFEWDKQNKLHLGIEALQKEAFDAAKAYQKQLHKTKKLKKSLSLLKGAKAKAAVQLPSHYQEKDKEKVEEEGKPAAEGVAPTMQTMLDSVDMNKGGDTEQTDDTVPATVPANISEVATQEGLKESEAEKSEQTKAEPEKTSFQSSMSVSASAAQATDSDDDLEISERLDSIMKEMIDMEKTAPGPPPRFVKMDVTIHSFLVILAFFIMIYCLLRPWVEKNKIVTPLNFAMVGGNN